MPERDETRAVVERLAAARDGDEVVQLAARRPRLLRRAVVQDALYTSPATDLLVAVEVTLHVVTQYHQDNDGPLQLQRMRLHAPRKLQPGIVLVYTHPWTRLWDLKHLRRAGRELDAAAYETYLTLVMDAATERRLQDLDVVEWAGAAARAAAYAGTDGRRPSARRRASSEASETEEPSRRSCA